VCVAVSHSRDQSLSVYIRHVITATCTCLLNVTHIAVLHRHIAEIIRRQDQKTKVLSLIVEVLPIREKKGHSASCKECKFTVPCAGETGTCWVVAVMHTREQNSISMLKRPTFDALLLMTISPTSIEAAGTFSGWSLDYYVRSYDQLWEIELLTLYTCYDHIKAKATSK